MMPPLAVLLVVLALTPVGLLLLHMVLYRLLVASGRRHVSGHSSAMPAIAVGFVAMLILATWLGVLHRSAAGWAEAVAGVVYIAIVYGAMSLLYIDAINIAETSLTSHTLLEISWAGTMSDQALYAKYSADHMVRARMDRLTSLGQIRSENGRHFLAGRWLLWFAQAVAFWRSVIGVPAPILLKKSARG